MSGTLLHLMRHGSPETPGLLMGKTNGAPTAAGIAACMDQVTEISFTQIISSDLDRSALAAAAIGKEHDVSVRTDPRWRELDFGDWDGLAPSQIDPAALTHFWNDPDACPPPLGERWSSLVGRVSAALDDLPRESTLVVTHGGAMRAAMSCLLGFDQRQVWAFDLPYGALLSFRVWFAPVRSAQIIGLWP